MAEIGRREEVGDQLAFNAREGVPDRSLPLSGIRSNNSTDNMLFREERQIIDGMTGLRNVLGKQLEQRQEEAMTQGKVDFMSGVTEAEMRAKGDYYTTLGYESLNAVNKANEWALQEAEALNGEAADMSPAEYKKHLAERNKALFSSLPEDPATRKIYLAAYEDLAPKLAAQHQEKHSARNYTRQVDAYGSLLESAPPNDPSRPRRQGVSNLAVSNTVIGTPYKGSGTDRDIAIKTMLGEAGGESDVGLAAVAHVLINRTRDSRWGGSVRDVALAPKQFSTWNKGAGGNNPGRYRPGTAAYERAGRIYDAVVEGKTNDPTNGATHYYSPGGMRKLVSEGSQSNLIPRWLQKEAQKSGGELRIGNHIFVGKANGKGSAKRAAGPQLDDTPNDAGEQIDVNSPLPEAPKPDANGFVDPEAQKEWRRQMEARAPWHPEPVDVEDRIDNAATPAEGAAEVGIATEETVQRGTPTFATIKEGAARLKPGDGAKQVAKTIAFQLAQGDTTLYDTIGGAAGVRELGGGIEEVASIQKAYDKYETDKSKEYDAAVTEEEDNILRYASEPGADLKIVTDKVQQLVDDQIITPQKGQQLAASAASKIRDQDGTIISVEAQRDVAANIALMQSKITADMTEDEYLDITQEFAENSERIAKNHNMKQDLVEKYTQQVFSEAKSKRESLIRDAEAANKKAKENQVVIDAVQDRINRGVGTDGLTGTIKIGDRSYNAAEWYVKSIDEAAHTAVAKSIEGKNVDSNTAGALQDQLKYAALIKAQVPDVESAVEMKAGASGIIVDSKGVPRADAVNTFDKFMRIGQIPDGQKYLSSILDTNTYAFLQSVKTAYSGSNDIDTALRLAFEEKTKVENDPAYKRKRDNDFSAALPIATTTATKKAIDESSGNMWGWKGSFDSDAVRNDKQSEVSGWLEQRANAIQMGNRYLSAEEALKMASDEMQNNSTVIGASIHIATTPDRRLDRVMGLGSLGRNAPQEAIVDWMKDIGESYWGQPWKDGSQLGNVPNWVNPLTLWDTPVPSFEAKIIDNGTGQIGLSIDLWKDPKDRSKGTLNKPYIINDIRGIGERWIRKQNERSVAAPFVDSVREFFRPKVRTEPDTVERIYDSSLNPTGM